MPRFQNDPSKTAFGIPLMKKGMYRLEIGTPKPFAVKEKDKDTYKNWGVRLPAKVIMSEDNPDTVGKDFTPIVLYDHSEGAQKYSKGIEAAILGVETDDEFNDQFGNMDWSYNTDDGTYGDGFAQLKGKIVDVSCGEPVEGKNADGSPSGRMQTVVERYIIAK